MQTTTENNKPASFDFSTTDGRYLFRSLNDDASGLEIRHSTGGIMQTLKMRLTAGRARSIAEWLQRYARWADTVPNQGGR